MTISNPNRCRFKRLEEDFLGGRNPVFTYIIECAENSFIKIGKSHSPEWRLTILQTGCPLVLKIVWAWPEDIEKELHAKFASRAILNEWFDVSADEAIAVAAMLTKKKWRNDLPPNS